MEVNLVGGIWLGSGVSFNGCFDLVVVNVGLNVFIYNYGVGACLIFDNFMIEIILVLVVNVGLDVMICSNEFN